GTCDRGAYDVLTRSPVRVGGGGQNRWRNLRPDPPARHFPTGRTGYRGGHRVAVGVCVERLLSPLIVIQKPDLSTVQTGDGELFEFLRDRSSRALCRSCNRDGATAGRVRGPAAEFYPHPGVDGGCVARLGRLGSDRLNGVVKFSCSQWESGTVDGGNDVAI